jgi:hypothetical protein
VLNPPPMHHWFFSVAKFPILALSWIPIISSYDHLHINIIHWSICIIGGKGRGYPFIKSKARKCGGRALKNKMGGRSDCSKTLFRLVHASAWRLRYRGFVILFGINRPGFQVGA